MQYQDYIENGWLKKTEANQKCRFVEYIKNCKPKDKDKPIFLSCNCPSCSPRFALTVT